MIMNSETPEMSVKLIEGSLDKQIKMEQRHYSFYEYLLNLMNYYGRKFQRFYHDYEIEYFIERKMHILADRPWLGLGIFFVIIISCVPIGMFLLFILTTLSFSFTSIVLIEGAIIAMATVCLIGCIIFITCIVFGIVLASALMYFGVTQIHKFLKSFELPDINASLNNKPSSTTVRN